MEQNGEFGRWVYVYKCYFNDIVIKHQGLKRKFDVVFHKHHYYLKKHNYLVDCLPNANIAHYIIVDAQ